MNGCIKLSRTTEVSIGDKPKFAYLHLLID